MVGFGSQVSASCVIRAHVIRSSWLRRRSVRRQRSVTWCRKRGAGDWTVDLGNSE